jgi:outer membrane immunogenic protein
MKNLLLAATAVFGAVAVIAPAFADEAPPEPAKHGRHVERAAPVHVAPAARPAPAQANPSWTGAQVGGQGGVAPMAQGFAEPGAYLFPAVCGSPGLCYETPFSFSGNSTSATGGGFVGYRIQFGTMVAGIEGDLNAKSASSSYSLSDSNAFRAENFSGSVKQGADGSVRGRFGFLVTPWVLVYGTGGVAFGSVSGSFGYTAHEIDGLGTAYATGGGSWSTTRSGATGGAGVEALITQSLTLRLEYRYTDLGRFSESVPISTVCAGTCGSPSSAASVNLHPTFQAVRVGVGYNF